MQISDWDAFKNFIDTRSISVQWIESNKKFILIAIDNLFKLEYILDKNATDAGPLNDFEQYYKDKGNRALAHFNNPPVSSLSNKYRIDINDINILLPNINNEYNRIYYHGDCGKFLSFNITFSSQRIDLCMKIDDKTVFTINCESLQNFFGCQSTGLMQLTWDSNINHILIFKPMSPISYCKNIAIYARANYVSEEESMHASIVHLTKEIEGE